MLQENKIWELEMAQEVKVQVRDHSGDLSLAPSIRIGCLTIVRNSSSWRYNAFFGHLFYKYRASPPPPHTQIKTLKRKTI